MIVARSYADHYGERDLTRPVVAITLAEKVAAVTRFGLDTDTLGDWTVIVDPDLDGMVIRWNYLRITVGERSDLELARFIARERAEGNRHVRRVTSLARQALGWGRGGGEPYVRCVVCRTSAAASEQHRPGSKACRDTLAERRVDHST